MLGKARKKAPFLFAKTTVKSKMHAPIVVLEPDEKTLAQAAARLRAGALVAFPTETVYGLGGDATNARAVAAIYEAKGRPTFNPLIVHVATVDDAPELVRWNAFAEKLAALFWPGPLTFVLPRAKASPIALLASAGLDTLALRCPDHAVARALISKVGRPLAAPSANASGKLSPTRAAHVVASLGGSEGLLVLDGGPCLIGVESTVLDLTGDVPTLLRHGGISKEALETVLGQIALADGAREDSPKSPGMLLSHYAPDLPLRLNVVCAHEDEAFLVFGNDASLTGGRTRLNLSPSSDLAEAAANLFDMLRKLDSRDHAGIAVAPLPLVGLGAAINDRLGRAAYRAD